MALVKLMRSAGKLNQIYLVSQGVGPGRPNQGDDVVLVQFFLKACSLRQDKTTGERLKPPDAPELAIDGVWGQNSLAYLRRFVAINNKAVTTLGGDLQFQRWDDGAVDSMNNANVPIGPLHHRIYVIIALNQQYADLYGTSAHAELYKDPLLPKRLADLFFV